MYKNVISLVQLCLIFALISVNSPQQVTCLEQSCFLLLVILKGPLLQVTFSTAHLPAPLPPP